MDVRIRLALLIAVGLASTSVAAQTTLRELARSTESSQDAEQSVAGEDSTGSVASISEQQIRRELGDRGIVAIKEWRRDGNVYRARAEWFGEPVDLHIDARSGEVKQPERLKGTQIEAMLKSQGWHGVRDVKRGGDTFSVRAERDSRFYDLKIDSKTGRILEWRPA